MLLNWISIISECPQTTMIAIEIKKLFPLKSNVPYLLHYFAIIRESFNCPYLLSNDKSLGWNFRNGFF
jgi:hypothetical protein